MPNFSKIKVKVVISKGNTKIGKTPNVSLVPVLDCGNCGACKKVCYALKAFRMYENVRQAWRANSAAARKHSAKYFAHIDSYIRKKMPLYFRWHVAGDILSQSYLDSMIAIARSNPGTTFLAFTKMHDLNYSDRPKNLTIVFSMFPGMPRPAGNFPLAWYQDGTETRIPKSANQCRGYCENCGICWHLRPRQSVFFVKH